MPIFDRRCACGWSRDDCYEPSRHELACPTCGAETERVWTSRPAAMHGDDAFVGGVTYENMGHEPVTVYSRAERKREMQKRGLTEFARHQPKQGSDKSSFTSRWI